MRAATSAPPSSSPSHRAKRSSGKTLVKECTLEPKEIIDRISAAGIVGLGGATFPTHVKLSPPPGAKAEVLIINAVECEPYLTSDHALMMSKSDEILVGVEILKRALGVSRAVIGVENNKKDAILRLSQIAMDYPGTEVMPLKVQYPQGGSMQSCASRSRAAPYRSPLALSYRM